MGRSSRPREKHEKGGEFRLNDPRQGTSARTRPYSYDEIMFKRNNKKHNENAGSIKEGNAEVGKIVKDSLIQNDFNVNKSEGGHRLGKDFSPGNEKHQLEELEKKNSHKKVENASRKNDSMSKHKNRENHESEKRLKSEVTKDTGIKDERRYEKQIHLKRKNERPARDFEHVDTKKHSRDLVEWDRHAGRSEGKSERDSKRKHQTRDDEQTREKTTKNHDMRKVHATETSDRKEKKESSRSHHEESHHKRRRSQSREREDWHRRSISLSPRAHKRGSHHVSEHERSSQGVKGWSGRHQSDNRSRMTSNGSSGHHRRHGGSTSGLGGYSPRKRKTEAAVRTPSPAHHSTEKRTAKWDLAPAETEKMVSVSVSSSNLQELSQTVSLNMHAVANAVPSVSMTGKLPVVASTSSLLSKPNVSFDSVQLTEATRPMRRLYVENVPASASEKAIMESFNNFLLSSGVNHIRGTKPCISCIIHKGKGQALVEFLTPEDASAALSFDGTTSSGSVLKIRRPKDFVEVTGELEKSEATVTTVSDIKEDSHQKIFIGGISKALSSEMLVEIAGAFGPLKAYQFETNEDLGGQYAFLEYVDQSITQKACAGLNGMKLGGQAITAVQAGPHGSSLGNAGDCQPCIPQLARPLLQKPTQVLKLKNLFPEDFSSLSEAEVEEVLEHVQLECSRFGTIKSVNVVKHANSIFTTGDNKMDNNTRESGTGQNLEDDETNVKTETMEEVSGGNSGGTASTKLPSDSNELMAGNSYNDGKPVANVMDNEICPQHAFEGDINSKDINHGSMDAEPCHSGGLDSNITAGTELDTKMAVEDLALEAVAKTVSQEVPNLMNTSKEESEDHCDRNIDTNQSEATNVDMAAGEYSNLEEVNGKLPEGDTEVAVEDVASKSESITISQEIPGPVNTPKEDPDSQYDKVADNIQSEVKNVEEKSVPKEDPQLKEVNGKLPEAVDGSSGCMRMESDNVEKDENSKDNNLKHIFEPGCVFVEYRRIEASCIAAHCIHGRSFDDRIVTVEYIDSDLYRVKFPK
ncbi:hypothetical protein DITRI_Ditri15bG0102900 [Diplodiscus trichospermus]